MDRYRTGVKLQIHRRSQVNEQIGAQICMLLVKFEQLASEASAQFHNQSSGCSHRLSSAISHGRPTEHRGRPSVPEEIAVE